MVQIDPTTTAQHLHKEYYVPAGLMEATENMYLHRQLERMNDTQLVVFRDTYRHQLRTLASGNTNENVALTGSYVDRANEVVLGSHKSLDKGYFPMWLSLPLSLVPTIAVGLLTSTVMKQSPLKKRILAGSAAALGTFLIEVAVSIDIFKSTSYMAINGLKADDAQKNIAFAQKEMDRRADSKHACESKV